MEALFIGHAYIDITFITDEAADGRRRRPSRTTTPFPFGGNAS